MFVYFVEVGANRKQVLKSLSDKELELEGIAHAHRHSFSFINQVKTIHEKEQGRGSKKHLVFLQDHSFLRTEELLSLHPDWKLKEKELNIHLLCSIPELVYFEENDQNHS